MRGDEWSIKIFNCSQNLNECSLARVPQIFALLASSQSKFFYFCSCSQKIAVLGMLAKTIRHPSNEVDVVCAQGQMKVSYTCACLFLEKPVKQP